MRPAKTRLKPWRRLSLVERQDAGARFKRRIVRQYFVRFHMGLMTTAAVASGFVSSKLLLEAGVTSVLIRYPLCVIAAYAVFIGVVRVWVGYVLMNKPKSPSRPGRLLDALDLVDGSAIELGSPVESVPRFARFGGGDSGGGGASDIWAADAGSKIELPGIDLDLDDGVWIIVLLAVLVLAIFGAGAYMIYAAPQLLPDVALNALLAPALARAAKRAESRGWLHSVVRSTWIPAAVILLFTIGLAAAIHHTCPNANKLTDAFACQDR